MDNIVFVELLRRAMQKDKRALEQVCEAKATDILYICTKLMGNKADGEDAAQEVLVRLISGIDKLRDVERFHPWLNRVIYNTCAYMRKKRHRAGVVDADEEALHSVPEGNAEFLPAQYLENSDRRQQVLAVLDSIAPQYREALILFYFHGLRTKEVAYVLGKDEKAVTNLLYRARKAMKEQLAETQAPEAKTGMALPVLTVILRQDAASATAAGTARRLVAGGFAAQALLWRHRANLLAVLAAVLLGASAISAAIIGGQPALPPNGGGGTLMTVPQQSPPFASNPPEGGAAWPPDSFIESLTEPGSSADSGGSAPYTAQQGPQVATRGAEAPGENRGAQASGSKAGSAAASGGDVTEGEDRVESASSHPGERETSSGRQPGESESTGNRDEESKTSRLAGTLQFVDKQGNVVEAAGYGGGFTVELYNTDGPLGAAVTGGDGTYAIEYTLPGSGYGGLYLYLRPPAQRLFTLAGQRHVLTPAQAQNGTAPPIAFTDTTAPDVVVQFLDGQGVESPSPLNPKGIQAEVHDATHTVVTWTITKETEGTVAASGSGASVALAGIQLEKGAWYTAGFTASDAAGNQRTETRKFILLGE